jgi:DNA polymerase-3 subunit alpha
MPDFDIDFCQGNRDRVIDYVKDKYGREAVSQIATFGTMAAKAALRDVGRVLGMGYGHVDSIAKLIPAPPGKTVTLAKRAREPDPGVIYARKEAPELEQREAAEEEVAELLSLATRVEGIVRNIGMHAGGVLIAPGKITDFCPLYQQPGSDSAVSQYDKDDVEAIGLVKFDFLGLATLTILELAKDFIRARRHPDQKDFDFATRRSRWTTRRVYKLFRRPDRGRVPVRIARHAGHAARRQAQPAGRPDRAERAVPPGPDGPDPELLRPQARREEVTYPHRCWAGAGGDLRHHGLPGTGDAGRPGVGGYSLGGADMLRRAMGKKKAEEMAKHRTIFRAGAGQERHRQGAGRRGLRPDGEVRGLRLQQEPRRRVLLLAYHTAWIKVHCTAEFYAGQHDDRATTPTSSRSSTTMPRRTSASPSRRPM